MYPCRLVFHASGPASFLPAFETACSTVLTSASWSRLFTQVPAGFRFAFKAPEEITTPAFPRHPRYGSRASQPNPLFLDSKAFIAQFLSPLEPFAIAVAVIIFEFPAAFAGVFEGNGDLSDALHRFLDKLPQTFRYAVEIRSPRVLCTDYFRTLRNHGIAHVFNSWTDMPSLSEQMANQDAF